MVEVDVRVSSHLKEELTWLWINGFGLLVLLCYLKDSKSNKELRIKPF